MGDTNGSKDFVYTTIDKQAPDFADMGQSFVGVPLSSVEVEYKLGAIPSPMPNNQKWMWVVGLTLAAWGIFYWSQKEK